MSAVDSCQTLRPEGPIGCLPVAWSQVVSFVVVFHVLFDEQAKVLLPKGDDFVPALGLDEQFVPLSLSMCLKQTVYNGSLSMMRYLAPRKKPSKGSVRLRALTRAICFIHVSHG